jgi:hypothetical protein
MKSAAVPPLKAGFAGRSHFARGVFTASSMIGASAWRIVAWQPSSAGLDIEEENGNI